MARAAEAFPENVSGPLYVDRTCIDCATCRELVPDVYTAGDGFSFVHRQPRDAEETERALMALVACPTGSIGTRERRDVRPAMERFPERVEDEVSFCGYTSKDSFGAWSYFIQASPARDTPSGRATSVQASPARDMPSGRATSVQASPARDTPSGRATSVQASPARDTPSGRATSVQASPARDTPSGRAGELVERKEGNVLVDSPRAAAPLLKALEARGGVATLLLTHRDDVADHAQLHARFGCDRVLHADDVTADTRSVERQVVGPDPVRLADDLLMIPTPGHTRGHVVYLYRDRFLFTGDHLAWSRRRGQLVGFRDACWYSWKEQVRSMEHLLDFSFEWVLPGHGERFHAASPAAMRTELERCIRWMRF